MRRRRSARTFSGSWASAVSWFIYADEIREHGDRVLALGAIRTVDRETREDRDTALGLVYTIRDGKIAAVEAYSSYADATAAVRAR